MMGASLVGWAQVSDGYFAANFLFALHRHFRLYTVLPAWQTHTCAHTHTHTHRRQRQNICSNRIV